MIEEFRKLNEKGLTEFTKWIVDGGKGLLPLHLLESRQYSVPTDYQISTDLPVLNDKIQFGEYLIELLDKIPFTDIDGDKNFWSTLALVWFDRITVRDDQNNRTVQELARYVLSLSSNNYRHLVRTPWALTRLHGVYSKFLLAPISKSTVQLSVNSDVLNNFGSRVSMLRNKQVVKLFSKLYYDQNKNSLKDVSGSRIAGGPRRAGILVRQLSLNYDLERMSEEAIFKILPKEYDQWKLGISFV